MVGTETLAIVVSSTTRKLPRPISRAAASSFPPVSGPAVATAGAAAASGEMDVEAVMAPSPSLAADINVGGHRKTDLQRVGGELPGIEGDADGQPLHDLDPV